jgi:hypothetical protein
MNWWMLAGGVMALVCTLGHAVAGADMYFRPMRAALDNDRLAGVVTGMWHLITINFSLSAFALIFGVIHEGQPAIAWFVGAQFGLYAAVYFVLSLRLGGVFTLFQWIPFAATAVLTAAAAIGSH